MELEKERADLTQLAQQRDATCSPGLLPGTECSLLQTRYDKAAQRLRQHESEYQQCQRYDP